MKPEFPLVQIDIQEWDLDLMSELLRFDEFYYSDDHEFYNRYFLHKRFLDSNGRIFLGGEIAMINSFWSWLGIGKKYRVTYIDTSKRWTFEEAKSFLISKIEKLSSQEGRDQWLTSLKGAKTIKQLIEAER